MAALLIFRLGLLGRNSTRSTNTIPMRRTFKRMQCSRHVGGPFILHLEQGCDAGFRAIDRSAPAHEGPSAPISIQASVEPDCRPKPLVVTQRPVENGGGHRRPPAEARRRAPSRSVAGEAERGVLTLTNGRDRHAGARVLVLRFRSRMVGGPYPASRGHLKG